jgi:cobalt-zinc-cadmium efflux system outer membrane protein
VIRKGNCVFILFLLIVLTTGMACPLFGQNHHPVSVPAASPEPAPPLSPAGACIGLPELEQLALQNNPTLAQAAHQVEAARGKALQAGLYPNPTVGYEGDLIGTKGTAGDFQGGFVQQTIVTAGKLRLSRAKYHQEAYEAELLAMGQQFRVLNGVRTGYYELLAAQRMVQTRREMVKNAEESLLTHKEMFNIGQANAAEVLEAEVEVDRARVSLHEQEDQYTALWEKVAAVVGIAGMLPPCLKGQLEPTGPPLCWETSLARLLEESPDLQAARAHIVRDQIALKREQVEPVPDVTVKGAAGYDYESRSTVANVQVGVKLPLWNRNQGTIRQAHADLARSHAEVHRLELSLRKSLAETFQKYQSALVKVKLYRESVVPKSKQAYQIMFDQYKKKRAEWVRVVEYQHKYLKAQSEYTTGLLELRRAEVAIQGLLLVDGLTAPPSPRSGGHMEATPTPR